MTTTVSTALTSFVNSEIKTPVLNSAERRTEVTSTPSGTIPHLRFLSKSERPSIYEVRSDWDLGFDFSDSSDDESDNCSFCNRNSRRERRCPYCVPDENEKECDDTDTDIEDEMDQYEEEYFSKITQAQSSTDSSSSTPVPASTSLSSTLPASLPALPVVITTGNDGWDD